MSADKSKVKIKKRAFKAEDLDRLLESVLYQLYERDRDRFFVILERLKLDRDGHADKGLAKEPQSVVK